MAGRFERGTTGVTMEFFLFLSSSSFFLNRSVPDSARDLATTTGSKTLATTGSSTARSGAVTSSSASSELRAVPTIVAMAVRGGEEGRGIEVAAEVDEGAIVDVEEEEEERLAEEEERDSVGSMGETRPSSKVRVASVRMTPVGGV